MYKEKLEKIYDTTSKDFIEIKYKDFIIELTKTKPYIRYTGELYIPFKQDSHRNLSQRSTKSEILKVAKKFIDDYHKGIINKNKTL